MESLVESDLVVPSSCVQSLVAFCEAQVTAPSLQRTALVYYLVFRILVLTAHSVLCLSAAIFASMSTALLYCQSMREMRHRLPFTVVLQQGACSVGRDPPEWYGARIPVSRIGNHGPSPGRSLLAIGRS